MSPASCHCSTPRRSERSARSSAQPCAQWPRLPRGPPRSTLRRWCGARPGSGWDGVFPHRSRPRARVSRRSLGLRLHKIRSTVSAFAERSEMDGLASAMRTARLQSVTRCPPAASLPGHLPGALPPSWGGTAHLGVGFPLRCCQRLSRPDLATQRCRLADNWHTSGPSSPVLSY